MAKKSKRKARLPAKPVRAQAPQGAAGLLQEAVRQLRRGSTDQALRLASQGLATAGSPKFVDAAQQVLAEVHFRAAVRSDKPNQQLQHLDSALKYTPDAARLHFHRGLVLGRLGRLPEALSELDAAAGREPARPGLAYLRQLARLATGQTWEAAGLAPAEANTLRVVQALLRDKPWPEPTALQEPLLSKGAEMWQALLQMRTDAAAAPVALLKEAVEKNGRKPISRILHYYRGMAAMRAGDRATAYTAWSSASGAGLATPWLEQNLKAMLREQILEPAQAGQWQDVVNAANRIPSSIEDRILAETIGLAYYHLGYEAAQAGKWPVAVQHWRKANEQISSHSLAQNLALAEEALGHWVQAAEAWRDMVRRRPRKTDHPDYLNDPQVAAIWDHVAECYRHVDADDQVLNSLKAAAKYAQDDATQRLKLVDEMLAEQRGEAATNELERILELEPQHEEALVRLGALYKMQWDKDAMSIWRRVLAINPQNTEAREELAEAYIERARVDTPHSQFWLFGRHPEKEGIKLLQEGLQELPQHPKLLLELGQTYQRAGKNKQAREYLLQAYEVASDNVAIVGSVLHELLHAEAGDVVETLLPRVRQLPHLLPGFWFDQGRLTLHCKLGEEWADFFFTEALALVGQPWVEETKASVLLRAYELAHEDGAQELMKLYEQRVRDETPASGAIQYIEAYRLYHEQHDRQGALKRIQQAQRAARAAKDAGVLKLAGEIEAFFKVGSSFGFFKLLSEMAETWEDEWN